MLRCGPGVLVYQLLFAVCSLWILKVCGKVEVVDLTRYPQRLQLGSALEISCTILYSSPSPDLNTAQNQVSWQFRGDDSETITIGINSGVVIPDVENVDFFERPKFQLNSTVLNDTMTVFTLTLPHLSTEVRGTYYCQDQSTAIKVKDQTVFINDTGDVELTCDGADSLYSNNQLGNVTWLRKIGSGNETVIAEWISNKIQPKINTQQPGLSVTHDTLYLTGVTSSDEGVYRCTSSRVVPYKNSTIDAPFDWTILLYVNVKPHVPGLPELVNSSANTLKVMWAASKETISSPVKYYTIQSILYHAYETAGNSWHSKALQNYTDVTGTEYVIAGLKSASQYAVRVIAWNDMGATLGPTNTDLKTNETKPDPPTVTKVERSTYSLTISWFIELSAGKITEFRLTVYSDNMGKMLAFDPVIIQAEEGQMTYERHLTNLSSATEYCYTIQSKNSAGYSNQGHCQVVKTDIGPPETPSIIEVTTISVENGTGTVEVLFKPPDCIFLDKTCLTYYSVKYSPTNCSDQQEQTVKFYDHQVSSEKSNRLVNLTNLNLGCQYEIRIAGKVESPFGKLYSSNYSEPSYTEMLKETTTVSSTSTTDELEKGPTKESQENDFTTIIISSVCAFIALMVIIFVIIIFIRYKLEETLLFRDRAYKIDEAMFRHRTGCVDITVPPPEESSHSSSRSRVSSIFTKTMSYFRKRRDAVSNLEQDEDLWIDLNTPLLGSNGVGYVESDYENIAIDGWGDHVKEMHCNSDIKFSEEYEDICRCNAQDQTWAESLEPANFPKNRYNNIVAYDHSRVILKTVPGVVHSDYINANLIDSYDKTQAFIATQGPLPNTLDDFWRMVWEKNTAVIVMITNVYEKHKKKCEQYWPNEGEARYGKLSVQLLSVEELAYWTIRKFTIKNTKVSKKKHQIEKIIVQYHYTDWPDHGVPEYTLPVLSFVKRACNSNPHSAGPIVVHCSAGVGRTGTFIVIESMMKQIMQKQTVNVQGFLRHIRSQRNHMVQTEEQYVFIHDALLDFIESGGRTDLQPKKFSTIIDELDTVFDNTGETILAKQYKTIIKWQPASYLTACAQLDVNLKKNRSQSFIPLDNSSRVRLPKIPGENGSDYINASYLQGYFQNQEFIITQHPAAHTEFDFWRMVWDQNSMTIVMLSNVGEEDLVPFYRPKGESSNWEKQSSFKLTCSNEDLSNMDYTVRDFMLESTQDDYEMVSRMFSITCWPEAYTGSQIYKDGVFQFVEVVNTWHAAKRDQAGPVIVIDKVGGKVAAQFCALYTLYNQFNHDTLIDIYTLAYLYHQKRPGVWETQEDYKLLYSSVLQLCNPDEDRFHLDLEAGEKLEFATTQTFASARRMGSISRSPEHKPNVKIDTL